MSYIRKTRVRPVLPATIEEALRLGAGTGPPLTGRETVKPAMPDTIRRVKVKAKRPVPAVHTESRHIRLPDDTWVQVQLLSEKDRRSVAVTIQMLIEEALDYREKGVGVP